MMRRAKEKILVVVYHLVLLGVFILFSTYAIGQEYPMRHFTVEDGLPSNTVYHVYRDSKGFLWVSTDKGVARYNGIKFERFTTNNGLADNEVFFVDEDLQNRIWFGTFNGKLCYYKDGKFHNPDNTPFLRQKNKHSHLARIYCEKDGSTSISYLDAGYFCNVSKDKCTEVQLKDEKAEFHYMSIYHVEKIDSSKYKVLASDYIFTVDISFSPTKILSANRYNDNTGRTVNGVFSVTMKTQNQPWLMFFDSTYSSINFENVKKLPPGIVMPAVRAVYTDHTGNIFCVTNQGLFVNNSTRLLSNENPTSITQDLNNSYWVGTLGNGMYNLSKNFGHSSFNSKAYTGKITYTNEVKDQLFFSLDNHKLYTFKNGKSECLITQKYNHADSLDISSAGDFLDTNFTFYHFRGQRNFVVSNVLMKSPVAKKYVFNQLASRHSFKRILKTANKLYLNTGFGVRSIDLANYLDRDSVRLKKLADSRGERIFAIARQSEGVVWYSSIDSLFKTVNDVGVMQNQYKGVSFKTFDFFGNYLVGITHNNELLIFDNRNDGTRKYSVQKDCIWENLYQLDSTHVLISTNELYYLLEFNSTSAEIPYSIVPFENGFIPMQAEAICIGNNDCYFFKSGNITRIAKSGLLGKTVPPVLYFTTVETSNSTYRINGPIELRNNESGHVTIAFSTVSFSGNALTYQYSMSEIEKDQWININGDINLTNPRFGKYTVKVRAKTAASDFSEPITLKFTILRPFWATWWFITSVICFLGTLIWFIVRNRINARIKKNEKEHETHVRFIKSEYKAMNALMNPHFVFNSINNVQSLVNDRDVLNATEYLGVFADLIRQNMHNISNDIIPLQKEIELVENYLLLEKLRFEDKLNYSINIAENTFLTDIMVPPLLLQPLVENSIKHGILPLKNQGRDGHVAINIFEEGDKLFIEVVDNGIGITKARQKRSLHESYGLANINNRVQQLSIILGKEMSFDLSEVFNNDGEPEGTKAIICIPIG